MKDWVSTGKLPPRDPAPMTARQVLWNAVNADAKIDDKVAHSTCSVAEWGVRPKPRGGGLWIKCTCEAAAYVTVPDEPENRESLKNMRRVY